MPCRRLAAVGLAVLVWACSAQQADGAKARTPARAPTQTHVPAANNAPAAKSTPATKAPPAKGPARAPSKPPLGTGGTGLSPEAEASASASPSGGDSLVSNGGGSPLCGKSTRAKLSPAGQRNCRSSDFEAAQAPTGNYAFDVHINTGVTDWGNDLSASVQNVAQWGWMLLVAIVHGVIVMLEWSYTVDLLKSSAMREVTKALSATQAAFTRPWLALALMLAAVLAMYHGIVRRRRARRVGQRSGPGDARRRGCGHARYSRPHVGGEHGKRIQRHDRRTVVLHGVRQRGLVRGPGEPEVSAGEDGP